MIEPSAVSGSCNNVQSVPEHPITTMVDRVSRVEINGHEKPAYIRAIVKWGVGVGCEDLFDREEK